MAWFLTFEFIINQSAILELRKSQTLSGKLSWSHYLLLLGVSDHNARSFYEHECENSNWSIRELDRQIDQDFMTIATIKNSLFESNVPINVPVAKSDEELLIDAIMANNKITMDSMATILGKNRKTVMGLLQKSTKIKRVGSDRYGHWEINDDESAKDEFEKQIDKTVTLARESNIKEESVADAIKEYHFEKKGKH